MSNSVDLKPKGASFRRTASVEGRPSSLPALLTVSPELLHVQCKPEVPLTMQKNMTEITGELFPT